MVKIQIFRDLRKDQGGEVRYVPGVAITNVLLGRCGFGNVRVLDPGLIKGWVRC